MALEERDIARYKVEFFLACREVCPSFEIPRDMKPLVNDIFRWCLMLDGRYDPDKGLWLWGDIGTGKSTMLEIIKRFCRKVRPPQQLRDLNDSTQLRRESCPYGFRVTNISHISGIFAREGHAGIENYIINCRQAFDEVGRETIPANHYGNTENIFQYIIQRRYDLRIGDFTHVTSNLYPEQIKDFYGTHIADRCDEMFNFVEMSGDSWR